MPLSGHSRKQGAVSHSTPEAEIVAADDALRTEGLPALTLWESLFKRKMKIELLEDNDAARTIMTTGKYPTLRHVSRTHEVDINWLHEVVNGKDAYVTRCDTKDMAADIFTKSFDTSKVAEWNNNIRLIAHVKPSELLGRGVRSNAPTPVINDPRKAKNANQVETPGNTSSSDESNSKAQPAGSAKTRIPSHSKLNAKALAAPTIGDRNVTRRIIEFCCSSDS